MQDWSLEQIVAVVSCMVWQEKQEKGKRLKESLQGPYAELQQLSRRIAKVTRAASCWQ